MIGCRAALRRFYLLLISAIAAACSSVPRPVSPSPNPSGQPLRAGFARVDITPPPGGGLFGYGPEGKTAAGYRMRLYARALVMEDATGERMAIVLTDLGANSVLVHRITAKATQQVGIGADRLLLAASHTHSGPTHHFGLIHDVFATGGEQGFNRPWVDELSARLARAVQMAVLELKPARAGWKTYPVWGVTHNRNLVPYRNNQQPWASPFSPPTGLTEAQRAIDPAWTMLRVDTRGSDGVYRPAGALSIFAMHGTGAPSANDLYDADLHGMISAAVERGIDAMNGSPAGARPAAFHLLAQGSEGDATAMAPETRCPVPTLINPEQYGPRPPLSAKLLVDAKRWEAPRPLGMERCIALSRAQMKDAAVRLADRALAEFRSIQTTDAFPIRRVFTTIYPGELKDQFCEQPRLGTATLAGPIDGQTRQAFAGIRYVEEGGSAVDPNPPNDALHRCHGQKRFLEIKLPILQRLTLRELYDLNLTPREAQLSVLRLGPQVLATLPAEITTTAGGRIKDAIAQALGLPRTGVTVIAVVNGYLNYITTADEYAKQHYEGSSTLYGPRSAESFKDILTDLSRRLPAGNQTSPEPLVGKATAWGKGIEWHRFASAQQGSEVVARCIGRNTEPGDTVILRFRDWYPGRFMRAPYPLLQFETRAGGGSWTPVAWDDDATVEVRGVRGDGRRGYWWEVRWTPAQLPAQWRLVLTARGPNAEIRSDQTAAACP